MKTFINLDLMMTNKQKVFAEEYLIGFNATKAAIHAGYSEKTAYSIGWENLRKPEIRSYINSKLAELSLSAEETTKLITDIAKGNLSDYFTQRQVERTPRIEKSLKAIIEDFKNEIAFEEEFKEVADFDSKEMKAFALKLSEMKRSLIRMELELKHNPKATRIVNDKTIFVEVFELDMKKLVADKERWRIKSITPGEHGIKVEIHDAQTALTNIARMHGLFGKDNQQHHQIIKVSVKRTNN
jgi:phage terminase small subunit